MEIAAMICYICDKYTYQRTIHSTMIFHKNTQTYVPQINTQALCSVVADTHTEHTCKVSCDKKYIYIAKGMVMTHFRAHSYVGHIILHQTIYPHTRL